MDLLNEGDTLRIPLAAFCCGCLRRDGGPLVDRPTHERFVMLGKTFDRLADQLRRRYTRKLLARDDYKVSVRPERVVRIAFNDLQASSRFPGGLALRFARVKGYRSDRHAFEPDTIDAVRAIYAGQMPRVDA